MFGGQHSTINEQFNDVYVFDYKNKKLKQFDYLEGTVEPKKRNSHTLVQDSEAAYIFGGANSDGPLKELYKLELKSLQFKLLKYDDSETKLPMLEMHTAELLNKK